MFTATLVATDDRSYFTDELEKLTGRSRSYWSLFSLDQLSSRLRHELKNKKQHDEEVTR